MFTSSLYLSTPILFLSLLQIYARRDGQHVDE